MTGTLRAFRNERTRIHAPRWRHCVPRHISPIGAVALVLDLLAYRDLVLSFLERASLDADGVIQIDADATGKGGVVPDIMVPLTEVTVRAVFVDNTDVVLQTAIDHLDQLTK